MAAILHDGGTHPGASLLSAVTSCLGRLERPACAGVIKHAWLESSDVFGYRKIHQELREVGEADGVIPEMFD